ncbi:hypothetical protein, partial [Mesorhizobium sp. M1A.F.Ca.IN.020.06.1.1]|uniref:hypothetical protein n=1 Tax=Mesorhizobium sp. M1A.F.Ca.IN.020.06.1.1 TaxID=2496765 RepID=UPI0019D4200F
MSDTVHLGVKRREYTVVDLVEPSLQIGRGPSPCSGGDLPKELPVRSLADVPYAPGLRKLGQDSRQLARYLVDDL